LATYWNYLSKKYGDLEFLFIEIWQIWAIFSTKILCNMNFRQISTWKIWFRPIQKKDIFMEKNGPHSWDFKLKNFQIFTEFFDNFQKVAKNIEGFCFFLKIKIKIYFYKIKK